jgi:hypothetical protein
MVAKVGRRSMGSHQGQAAPASSGRRPAATADVAGGGSARMSELAATGSDTYVCVVRAASHLRGPGGPMGAAAGSRCSTWNNRVGVEGVPRGTPDRAAACLRGPGPLGFSSRGRRGECRTFGGYEATWILCGGGPASRSGAGAACSGRGPGRPVWPRHLRRSPAGVPPVPASPVAERPRGDGPNGLQRASAGIGGRNAHPSPGPAQSAPTPAPPSPRCTPAPARRRHRWLTAGARTPR